MRFELRVSRFLAGVGLAAFSFVPAAAWAQSAPVVSRPIVQAIPSVDPQKLSDALTRLGRDPRDVNALMDAADAARSLGDYDASIGFYRRAEDLSPNNARIKSGLASALVLSGDPVAAIPVFAEAERAGARASDIASDRGLAFDLVGDNATAQRYYIGALNGSGDDEARLRYAVSQAIAGDVEAAQQTLMPLLRKQDKPGWRTRAFTLAIVGDTKEAVDLANRILPAPLAQNVAPYLRYMPRLTKAQQAAAANLGKFPKASEIGRDDPRIATYKPVRLAAAMPAAAMAQAPAYSDKASRQKAAKAQAEQVRREAEVNENRRKAALASASADRVAPPDPKPTIEREMGELPPRDANGELPPVNAGSARQAATAASMARAAPTPAPTPAPVRASAEAPAPAPVTTPPPRPAQAASATSAMPASPSPAASAPPRPAASTSGNFDLARIGGSASPPPPASPSSVPVVATSASSLTSRPVAEAPPEPGPSQLSLSEIFADLGKPTAQAMPASGAVDIRKIIPAKPKPKEEPKPAPKPEKPAPPPPPAHPSRIWVQIGVGRDKSAIAFDWRRHLRETPELFKGRKPYVSEMGRTNRILVGPFETSKAANEFAADVRKADVANALPWTSPAGQVVDELPAK